MAQADLEKAGIIVVNPQGEDSIENYEII